jgi:LysW-gamma-L-lysine carboxypeptidase
VLVAGAARFGSAAATARRVRIVVVGAVEEEAATSKGARAIAARFDGTSGPRPHACVIGEPSGSRRVTLGYKGRLLLDVHATQAMAHTAGPEPGVATHVVNLWNRVVAHSEAFNQGRARLFDQLSPSLRALNTSTTEDMCDHASATIAWRLPLDCDTDSLIRELTAWASSMPAPVDLRFHAQEPPWRGDRQNVLVRSFLSAIRFVDPSASPGFVLKTGTSDMNVVGPVWKCPIVAYGPGDSSLDHTPREHVHLDEFWQAVQVVEAMLHALAERLAP